MAGIGFRLGKIWVMRRMGLVLELWLWLVCQVGTGAGAVVGFKVGARVGVGLGQS